MRTGRAGANLSSKKDFASAEKPKGTLLSHIT